jgi:hypothetical protein
VAENDPSTAKWVAHCLGHLHTSAGNYSAAVPGLEHFLREHGAHEATQKALARCRAALAARETPEPV